METNTFSFAVHVVVHGQLGFVRTCTESVLATTPASTLVRIWDNASDTETQAYLLALRLREPRVVVYCSPRNFGFGAPHNSMVRDASEDILCLLNSDSVVEGDWWHEAGTVASEPAVGVVGPIYKSYHLTQYIEGCCLFLRRDVAVALGPFDTRTFPFAYCEDTDLSARAISIGYRLARVEIPGFAHSHGSPTSTALENGGTDVTGIRVRNQQIFRHRWPRSPVRERTVIRRQGAIGDVLCLIPALRAFARTHPLSRIEVETLVPEALHSVPEISTVRYPESWLPEDYQPDFNLDNLPEQDNYLPADHLHVHIVDQFARALKVELLPEERVPSIYLRESERVWCHRRLPETYVVFGTETGWSIKTWTQWDSLAKLLRDVMPDLTIVWLGANSPDTYGHQRLTSLNDIDLRGELGLRRCFSVIERAILAITGDTGLFHVAAALRTPSIGLFGPVFSALRRHAGQNAIDTPLRCGGCYHRQTHGIAFDFHTCERQDWRPMTNMVSQSPCMAAITPAMVAERAIDLLRERL